VKVQVVGHRTQRFEELARSLGVQVVTGGADLLVAYGGDGTFIGAERAAPGLPKLGLRHDDTCEKCERHNDRRILERLLAGELPLATLAKIEARIRDQRVLALNDVIVRNVDPRAAVRFSVALDGEPATEEMIGDGLLVCTPFGSSGYFRSITRCVTRIGFGIAFNNCTDPLNHLIVSEETTILVDVARGPGVLAADNDERTLEVVTGDRLQIARARESARVYGIDTLRCPDCRYVNAARRRY
jgi:NAD+ kinase